MTVRVIEGDCLKAMPQLAAEGLLADACVTDPPYHLTSIVKRFGAADAAPAQQGSDGRFARTSRGFMGKQWDGGDVAFRPNTWALIADLLKSGAHLIAFGGTRTYHRMACAIEDAGFEIRDQIGWLYGSGFPKSHNVGDGWGTALKPAWEPIVLARKPLVGTVAANFAEQGTGALNIDGCRVATAGETISAGHASSIRRGNFQEHEGWDRPWKADAEEHARRRDAAIDRANTLGRWPANVIHDGSDEVLEAFGAYGERPGAVSNGSRGSGFQGSRTFASHDRPQAPGRGDRGTAARFFYSAKAGKDDRAGSKHPTVKPVDLIAYLCRLVTPPGGIVLDPFAGSGTTGTACMREGFRAVLIEREAEYVADIRRRLAHVSGHDAPLFAGAVA